MKAILVFALSCFALIVSADDLPERPNLQGGKLFTVEVFPRGKSLEIKVAGKETVDAKLTSLGLVARLHVGKKTILLTPVKRGSTFHVVTPETKSESRLELKVEEGLKHETFEFDLQPHP